MSLLKRISPLLKKNSLKKKDYIYIYIYFFFALGTWGFSLFRHRNRDSRFEFFSCMVVFLHSNSMFVLSEENGREEKKNKREQKNVGPSDKFFIKFSSFSILSCYPNRGKDLISLPFPPLPLKPNIV